MRRAVWHASASPMKQAWAVRGGVGLLNDSLKLEAGAEKNRFVKIRLRVDAHAKQFAFDNFCFPL